MAKLPVEEKLEGSIDGHPRAVWSLPKKGVTRYILTSAQNNTRVHDKVLNNLEVLAEYYDAQILCSRFTYNKAAYGKMSVKPGTEDVEGEYDELWYDERLEEYFNDEQVELAPGLVWCGEMNILPTAAEPLSEMENYTGRASSIFPHTKQHMVSVAAPKGTAVKLMYSTGTVTKKNYIKKKAGLKAERYHVYGALLVEVLPSGVWFVRQLSAAHDGSICDNDVKVVAGQVTYGNRIEAINWGDIHWVELNSMVRQLAWGPGGMLDTLKPKTQFWHDTLDWLVHHRHNERNHHAKYFHRSHWLVDAEVQGTCDFMVEAARPWCADVVVYSNHDDRFRRWLQYADYREDPFNAEYFLEAQLAYYRALKHKQNLNLFQWAAMRINPKHFKKVKFLREDESYVICKRWNGGIECGMHGHLGADGSDGGAKSFAKMGRAANVGHSHKAGIYNEVFTSGESSDPGYSKGPSSHTKSHIVTYSNGQRAIITLLEQAWRAPPP